MGQELTDEHLGALGALICAGEDETPLLTMLRSMRPFETKELSVDLNEDNIAISPQA